MRHPEVQDEPGAVESRGFLRRNGGVVLVLALLCLSVTLGFAAYASYRSSEKSLTSARSAISKAGASLSVEQCVDRVLHWARRCRAMKSLCDASVTRMMAECMSARDRTKYCRALGKRTMTTGFGYRECKARKLPRRWWKSCGLAYRGIGQYCGRYEDE